MSNTLARPSIRTLSLLGFAGLTYAAIASAALSGVGESKVQFEAVGPGGLKIEGEGTSLSASETAGTLKVSASLTGLKTGISLRDEHLQKAINASKHPNATLEVSRSALKFPEDNKSVQSGAVGKFTLNGTTKDVKFGYKVERTGSDYHVQGLATIDITQFNLEKPCYLGVCVDKDVKVKVKFKLREQ